MRLSDLRDVEVRTLDGQSLGRVHEVHCEKGAVTALMCGAASFIERLTARDHGRRIPWERVVRVSDTRITVSLEPETPRKKKKPSGPRTPKRTPRASGRRSGR